MINNKITVKRKFENIGWVGKLNFVLLPDGDEIKMRYYNNRICFQLKNKRIGYRTFVNKSEPCNIIIDFNLPF